VLRIVIVWGGSVEAVKKVYGFVKHAGRVRQLWMKRGDWWYESTKKVDVTLQRGRHR